MKKYTLTWYNKPTHGIICEDIETHWKKMGQEMPDVWEKGLKNDRVEVEEYEEPENTTQASELLLDVPAILEALLTEDTVAKEALLKKHKLKKKKKKE